MQPFVYDVRHLEQLWAAGLTYMEIAAALGCRESLVHKLKKRHSLPNRGRRQGHAVVDPTPDEIASRAAEIRKRHLAEMRALPWP